MEASIDRSSAEAAPSETITVSDVIEAVSQQRSSWSRADVLRAICDLQRPVSQLSGRRWADTLERGHVEPANTCWYLSAVPELMQLVAARLDEHEAGER